MRNFLARCLSSSLVMLMASDEMEAQVSNPYSIGLNVGAFIYNGDLSPWRTGSWKTPAFVWGLTGHRNLSSALAIRAEINFGKLRGDEAKYSTPEYRQYRAFAFNSSVTELVLAGEWSPFGNSKKLSPYAFAGVGYAALKINRDVSHFNAAYFAGEPALEENLKKDLATSLPNSVAVFPAGVGVRYNLNENVSLHAEAAQRFTRSDYIDGFSQSGNPKLKDSYTKYSLGLRFSFGKKDPFACPTIYY